MSRNFQVFEPWQFLAEVTQHIPDKGQHKVLYFGFYSNKQRGLRNKKKDRDVEKNSPVGSDNEGDDAAKEFAKKRCFIWAALIKSVYAVDPLECPNCGGKKRLSVLSKNASRL